MPTKTYFTCTHPQCSGLSLSWDFPSVMTQTRSRWASSDGPPSPGQSQSVSCGARPCGRTKPRHRCRLLYCGLDFDGVRKRLWLASLWGMNEGWTFSTCGLARLCSGRLWSAPVWPVLGWLSEGERTVNSVQLSREQRGGIRGILLDVNPECYQQFTTHWNRSRADNF